MAVSTASAPVFAGSTMPYPKRDVNFWANGPKLELWKALDERVNLDAWSVKAFTSLG